MDSAMENSQVCLIPTILNETRGGGEGNIHGLKQNSLFLVNVVITCVVILIIFLSFQVKETSTFSANIGKSPKRVRQDITKFSLSCM